MAVVSMVIFNERAHGRVEFEWGADAPEKVFREGTAGRSVPRA